MDLFFNTLYEEEFRAPSSVSLEQKTKTGTSMTIFQFLNTDSARLSFLAESFQQSIKQRSLFGFSEASLHAMKGWSLVYRISKRYEDAEKFLSNALSLVPDLQDGGIELESDLLLNLGRLYLNQKKPDNAEKQFIKVTQRLQRLYTEGQNALHLKGLEGLSAVHFQRGSL